jgi:flavin-binding protein dodecin
MPEKTYKLVEIVGVSDESVQQAIRNGIAKASQTLRNIDWFEVVAIRGSVRDNRDPVFQVQLKVGFRLLDRDVLHGSDDEPAATAGADGVAARSRSVKAKDKAGKGRDKRKKK